MNLWPPFLFTGIHVVEISPDWMRVRVELRSRPWNRNYVGVHFGGSLFAMTDPFYMLMYLQHLGRELVVWDYAASIRFERPGRGTVSAEFRLAPDDLERARTETRGGERFLHTHPVEIRDASGERIALVERTLYFRRKRDRIGSD